MTYEQWEAGVPDSIKNDSLWKVRAYRLALFLDDIGWGDVTKLSRDKRTYSAADQLFRSSGSISANIAEGYSRTTGKERARFYEFALGSARETRGWYFKSRHLLGETVVEHRMEIVSEIVRLTLRMIPDQRASNRKLYKERAALT